MKKIISLFVAFMAIFCTTQAQTVTNDSFFKKDQFMKNYPQNLIELKDQAGVEYGFILVYSEAEKVIIFYIPADKKEILKRRREKKKIEKMILAAYWQHVSKQEVKIKEKVYKDKKLNHIVLEKENT